VSNKPKKLYANSINLSGLASNEPYEVYWDDEVEEYYDKIKDFSVKEKGLCISIYGGVISFSSTNKKEVEAWTNGVRSTMTMLSDWSNNSNKKYWTKYRNIEKQEHLKLV